MMGINAAIEFLSPLLYAVWINISDGNLWKTLLITGKRNVIEYCLKKGFLSRIHAPSQGFEPLIWVGTGRIIK
jgi:hypothetical protein